MDPVNLTTKQLIDELQNRGYKIFHHENLAGVENIYIKGDDVITVKSNKKYYIVLIQEEHR